MRKAVYFLWIVALAICVVSPNRSNAQDEQSKGAGAVFVMTNAADRNEVISFKRAADGSLQESRRFCYGRSRQRRQQRSPGIARFPHPEPGSHTAFCSQRRQRRDLSLSNSRRELVSRRQKLSGGSEPNAVAQNGHLVYVLNAGGKQQRGRLPGQ